MMMTEQPGKFTKISMNCIIWKGELDDMQNMAQPCFFKRDMYTIIPFI